MLIYNLLIPFTAISLEVYAIENFLLWPLFPEQLHLNVELTKGPFFTPSPSSYSSFIRGLRSGLFACKIELCGNRFCSWCDGSSDRSFMVDPLDYFLFQPELHDWRNKGHGMCYPVCGMVHIKEPNRKRE